jgi:dynactin complex subunit
VEGGDSKAEAEANLRAKFDQQMEDEYYDAEEANKIWNDHHSYAQEIEETESDEAKTMKLVDLAIRYHEEVEAPAPGAMAHLFQLLAQRDVITLELMLEQHLKEQTR